MKHILTLAALVFATACFGQEACPNMYDGNGNGTIDIEDFLGILGLFGDVDVDSDGLWDSQDGCSDTEACNFFVVSAAYCLFPDALGDCNGNCPLDEDEDGVCDVFACGGTVNFQGYDYATVLLGEQCWFAENLRNQAYQNGDEIWSSLSTDEWNGTWGSGGIGACAVFGEGDIDCHDFDGIGEEGLCDSDSVLAVFGRLYNWHAVKDSRGLCPVGWHVPTDSEWNTMEIALGLSPLEASSTGLRGNHAPQMRDVYGWPEHVVSDNSSGFSGLPGGMRDGPFYGGGELGLFWTSSQSGGNAWSRGLYEYDGVLRYDNDPEEGRSVRCIQDSE